MDPLSFLKSIIRSEQLAGPKPLTLKAGQIINGKIIRILPNSMAVVQIDSHRLIAKLEASLAENQPYNFEVQSYAGKIHLKLVKDSVTPLPKDALDTIKVQKSPDGFIEQFYTQVPIQIGQENVECSIQWNGRKRKDGKIDPDNCRILFFVELTNLGEIIVDLQFQNRKIQLVMVNSTQDLKELAHSHFSLLKENLQKLNFQLSVLKVVQPSSEKSLKALIKKTPANDKKIDLNQGMGLDIRV